MDQGVWYDRDWMISTITHPARNAHGSLKSKQMLLHHVGFPIHSRLKYFIRRAEIIEFDYTNPTSCQVQRRQKTKYSYMKGPDPS